MTDVVDRLAAAVQLHRAGNAAAAAIMLAGVLAEKPEQAGALYLYGLLKMQAGDVASAADLLERAARVRPAHVESWAALAAARLSCGDNEAALDAAEAALRLQPAHACASFVRGTALGKCGRYAEAAVSLLAAVRANPDHADACLNLGNALLELDDLAGAEQRTRSAVARAPELAQAHASLGHVLCCQGRYEAAIAACREAVRLQPALAEAHWNLGIASLLAGDFHLGWQQYEWRKRHPDYARDFPTMSGKEWEGESLAGRHLLITAEQGLGDTIQFARYLPLLREQGADVVLACAAPLIPLLERLVPCIDKQMVPEPEDLWIDQMSLPLRFATRIDSIPASSGYLQADPVKVATWQRRLPAGRRIGLVWAGNPAHSNDCRRSLPPGALAGWHAPEGSCFIGLQLGARQLEAAEISGLLDVSVDLTDYAETAAALACLDLLISVDTSVVHLAGAMGRPAWVLLPYAPDWRWLAGRDDSPWYTSLRLFRQSAPGEWSSPLSRVAAALAGYV